MESVYIYTDEKECQVLKLFVDSNSLNPEFMKIFYNLDDLTLKLLKDNIDVNIILISENVINLKFHRFKIVKEYIILSKKFYHLIHKDKIINMEEIGYLDTMHKIFNFGELKLGRNGNTFSLFHNTLEFDLSVGFPLLTTKKMFFRGIVSETLFFLSGQTDAKILSKQGVKIWDDNTSRETLDKLGFSKREEGDMGPLYGHQFYHFGAEYVDSHSNYKSQGFDQIEYVINLLLNDRNSRRMIMTSFNPGQAQQGCLYPCHSIVIQFYVRDGKYLDTICYNRSQDLFLGVPWNISYIALFVKLMVCYINLKKKEKSLYEGKISLIMGDTHIYENHKDSCLKQLLRLPYRFPKVELLLNTEIKDITFKDYIKLLSFDNLKLSDYNHHSKLGGSMIV